MSKRVHMAMALDDVEQMVVKQCGKSVENAIRTTDNHQAVLIYHIVGAVEDAARKHEVEFDWLWEESLKLLRDELYRAIGGFKNNHEYIKPYVEGGRTVGLKVSFYMFGRSACCSWR